MTRVTVEPIRDCLSCPVSAASRGRCPFTPVSYGRGTLLCAQGEPRPALLFVRDGQVALSSVDERGVERAAFVRGPRSLLNAEALAGAPATFEIRALTATRVCQVTTDRAREWVMGDGPPARLLLDLTVNEIRAQQKELLQQKGDCLARVARFALERGEARPLRKQSIARLLGMRPETFSRCLTKLASQGYLDASNLKVLDREGLERAAAA